MKFQLSTSLGLFLLASTAFASETRNKNSHIAAARKRQAPPAAAPVPAAPVAPAVPAQPSAPVQPSAPGQPAQPTNSAPGAVYTRSPDGIMPLAGITSGMPAGPAATIASTYAPGAKPTHITNAPGLPEPFVFVKGEWPDADHIVPGDSPEVKEWMKELDGWDIPNLNPTVQAAACDANPQEKADAANRGWWTCGGYTRDTDIVACPTKYDWGVSFDDGPTEYTPTLLKYLNDNSIKSTFFVVGSRVIESPKTLIDAYMHGHEISVHTWSHFALTTMTNEQIVGELGWSRKVIKEVLGVTPTTMRPPYGDIDDRVRAISMAMGLNPIMWTATPSGGKFDTNDWKVPGGLVTGPSSFETFQGILGNASALDTGFIVLQHDLYPQCVDLAIGYTLKAAQSHNPPFHLKTIGQCMNLDPSSLYMETNSNDKFPGVPKVATAAGKSAPSTPGAKGIDSDGDGKVDTKSAQSNTQKTTENSAGLTRVNGSYLAVLGAIAFFASCL